MKQSKAMSLYETLLSTAIGLVVAFTANLIVLPWFGMHPSLSDSAIISIIFTVISVVRGFFVRRLFEALHIRTPLSSAMLAVIAERRRQVDMEGWTAEHDDQHPQGELARAGACYAMHAGTNNPLPPPGWPWFSDWWKPAGFRRDLVRAGALILAEIERHDRQKRGRKTDERASLPGT